jgi:hypothetical protein
LFFLLQYILSTKSSKREAEEEVTKVTQNCKDMTKGIGACAQRLTEHIASLAQQLQVPFGVPILFDADGLLHTRLFANMNQTANNILKAVIEC